MVKMVVMANAVPPVAEVYHLIKVPVAVKLATVAEAHNVCAEAVGAISGVVTVHEVP